jgi:4-carboxymuconolactone decarboxylase
MIANDVTNLSELIDAQVHAGAAMPDQPTAAALGTSAPPRDRLPPIAEEAYTEAQRQAAEEFAAGRGYAVSGPFVPLIRSPEVMLRAKAMGDYLRFRSALEARLSEMIILIVAREWTQQYEWAFHHGFAVKAGLRQEIIDAIADGRRPVDMADDEEAAYEMSIELQRTKRVSDESWRKAIASFGEQGVIDLIGLNGYYTMLAMTMNAARTAVPPGMAEPLKYFP